MACLEQPRILASLPLVLIAPASLNDAARTIALWMDAGLTRPWNDPSVDFVRALESEQATVLLATEMDSLRGSVMVGDDGHRGWMYYLAVAVDARRQGVGAALVGAAEGWLAGRGQTRVRLMVRNENRSVLDFYAAQGYTDQDCVVLGRTLDD